MSDKIENDDKFVRLMQRLVYEHEQVRTSRQVIWDLNSCDLLTKDITVKLEDINRDLKVKSEITIKHIFKYIDRYAQRKVLEERAKQPLKVNMIGFPPCSQESPVGIRYFTHPLSENSVEMMRIYQDGLCHIHKDYCSDVRVLKNLKNAIVEQIIKINPGLVLLPKFYIDFKSNNFHPFPTFKISFSFENPGGIEHIVSEFIGAKSDHFNSGDRYAIVLPKLAKYFSDEVNKIARDKYAPR